MKVKAPADTRSSKEGCQIMGKLSQMIDGLYSETFVNIQPPAPPHTNFDCNSDCKIQVK